MSKPVLVIKSGFRLALLDVKDTANQQCVDAFMEYSSGKAPLMIPVLCLAEMS